jgi:hypothetical protein
MKKEQLFLIFLFSLGNNIVLNSQCENCPSYGAIVNGNFEIISSAQNCQPPATLLFYGRNLISDGCVNNWMKLSTFSTPDLINPNMGLGSIDSYITSNMGGICYLSNHSNPGEDMASPFSSYLIPGNDIEYSIEFDLAGMCVEFNQAFPENSLQLSMIDGEIDVYLNSNIIGVPHLNVGTFSLDSGNDIFTSGIERICISGISLSNVRSIINFEVSTSNPQGGFESCYALVDNLEITCEIVDHDLSIDQNKQGNGLFTFEILDNGQSISGAAFQSYSWDFGDGQISLPPNASSSENHQYTVEGIYDLCVQVVDSRGCCANICTKVFVGEYCDYILCLDCLSSGVPLASDLYVLDPSSGLIETFNNSIPGCCFTFPYCFGDPGFCQQQGSLGGYQYNELAIDINSYLQSIGDPGHAYIYYPGINDPNYPCRFAVLRIDHTHVTFLTLLGYDAVSGTLATCNFIEDCY